MGSFKEGTSAPKEGSYFFASSQLVQEGHFEGEAGVWVGHGDPKVGKVRGLRGLRGCAGGRGRGWEGRGDGCGQASSGVDGVP